MKRKTTFKKSVARPIQINDSRFGQRKLFMNDQEKPSIFSYANPGRHWHGTR